MVSTQVDRFAILSTLGEGGMGVVYLAQDGASGDQVALKVLSKSAGGPEAILQFKQEFRTMTRLKHPHTVEVYDFGQLPDGTPYFSMEVVPGQGLDDLLPLDPAAFRDLFVQLCRALAFIHGQGLVHCDLKPDNVRVTPDGTLKLMDFGLMGQAGQSGGAIKGTLDYLAPEVAKRSRVDQRADLYSLGALAFHMLVGRPPFTGKDPVSLIRAHLEAPVPPLEGVDPQLARVVTRLLAKDPTARYASCAQLLADLGVDLGEAAGNALLTSPFVGRDAEFAALQEAFAGARKGQPTAVTLVGDTGVGKSRLLEELRFAVQLEGATFVGAVCQEGDPVPYGPFLAVLRGLMPQVRRDHAALLDKHGAVLASILPELGGDGARGDATAGMDPRQVQILLQAAVTELMVACAGQGSPSAAGARDGGPAAAGKAGLVVALDDWQWADGMSRALLDYVERNAGKGRLLVVRATREGGDTKGDVIQVGPLAEGSVGEMVAAILGEAPAATFLSAFARMTGGNPLFVEASVKHLVEKGTLVRQGGRWATEGLVLTESHLPGNLKALLWERFEGLSPEAFTLAQFTAAAMGNASLSVLRRAAQLSEDAAMDAVSELMGQGLVVAADGQVRFAQGQYSELIYGALDDARREDIHSALATALEGDILGHAEGHALGMEDLNQLARHFLRSRFPAKAVVYALEAGMRNLGLFASREAVALLEAGWHRQAEVPDVDRRTRLQYQRYLGDGYRITSRLDQAEEAYQAALALAEELDEKAALGSILTGLGTVFQIRSRYAQAKEVLERSLQCSLAIGDDHERLRAMTYLYRVCHFQGEAARAIKIAEDAIELARQVGQQRFLSDALSFLGLLYVSTSPERIPMGMEFLHEAIGLKQHIGDRRGLNDAYMLLGNAQMALGQVVDSRDSFRENQRICRELGIVDDEVCSYLNLGVAALELGEYDEAFTQASTATRMAEETGNATYRGMALAIQALGAAYQGILTSPRKRFADAMGLTEGNQYLELFVRVNRMEYGLIMGDMLGALEDGARAEELQSSTGINEFEARLATLKGEAFLRLGELVSARETLAHAKEVAEKAQNQAVLARVLAVAGQLALAYGDVMEAKEHALRAVQLARAIQIKGVLGDALVLLARLVHLLGEPGADTYLQEALHIAERMECPHMSAVCLFTSAQLGDRKPAAVGSLRQAQEIVSHLMRSLSPEEAEQFLAVDHRWRIVQGDLSLPDLEFQGNREGSTNLDQDKRYQGALTTIKRLQGEMTEMKAANHRLEQLMRFTVETNHLTDLEELLRKILELVVAIAGAERGFLLLHERGMLRCRSMFSTNPTEHGNPTAWQFSQSIADKVYGEGKSLFLADAMGEEGFAQQKSVMDLQIRTVVCVPLESLGTRIGVLYVDRQSLPSFGGLLPGHAPAAPGFSEGAFEERDLMMVEALANQATQIIENARLYAEGRERAQHMEMLNSMARSVSTTLVLSEVLDLVIENTLKLTRADRAFLFLKDDSDHLLCRDAKDREGRTIAYTDGMISQSICQKVMTSGEALSVVDTQDHEEFQAQRSILALNLRTVMAVPLSVKRERLGVLYVDSQEVVNAFSERDLDLLTAIASQASVAIENAALFEKATVDGLTKLYFRSFFESRMAGEIKRSERVGNKVSLMMIDIDHFKKFNDTYGHQTGDDVLRLVAGIIRDRVRTDLDVPCRFGGEEMLVLMPDTDTDGAAILAERLREAIELAELPGPNGEILHVRVSIGVSTLPTMARTAATLIEAADQALYASKRNGRNQVTVWRTGLEMDPKKHPAGTGH